MGFGLLMDGFTLLDSISLFNFGYLLNDGLLSVGRWWLVGKYVWFYESIFEFFHIFEGTFEHLFDVAHHQS